MKMSNTLQAIYDILMDGLPHTKEELHKCCGPSSIKVVKFHISKLRDKLPGGLEIVAVVINRTVRYRMVRHVHSANDGRR